MTSSVPARYNAEEDAEYLFNQLRALPEERRDFFCANELHKLESYETAATTAPTDIIYMRKVWLMVRDRVLEEAKPKIEIPVRNVRYSKRFE